VTYWVEIHCDAVLPNGVIARYNSSACHSFHCNSPGAMSDRFDAGRAAAISEAKHKRWKRTRRGWVCPGCQREGFLPPQRAATVEPSQ
jgi:hypothetical protein